MYKEIESTITASGASELDGTSILITKMDDFSMVEIFGSKSSVSAVFDTNLVEGFTDLVEQLKTFDAEETYVLLFEEDEETPEEFLVMLEKDEKVFTKIADQLSRHLNIEWKEEEGKVVL